MVAVRSLGYRFTDLHVLRQREREFVEGRTVIASNIYICRSVGFKDVAHRRSPVIEQIPAADVILHPAGSDEPCLACFKIVCIAWRVFFEDTLCCQPAVGTLSKVCNGIGTAAELLFDRLLSAVGVEGIAVVQHCTDLLSLILYSFGESCYKNQFRSFRI